MTAAGIILGLHLIVIGFNLFGLVAIPVGAGRGWPFVHRPWFRLLHFVSLTLVAIQALVGQACVLTIWQDRLSPLGGDQDPLIMRWVNALIFWPLPGWFFTALYLAIWLYTLALLWIVPLRHRPCRANHPCPPTKD